MKITEFSRGGRIEYTHNAGGFAKKLRGEVVEVEHRTLRVLMDGEDRPRRIVPRANQVRVLQRVAANDNRVRTSLKDKMEEAVREAKRKAAERRRQAAGAVPHPILGPTNGASAPRPQSAPQSPPAPRAAQPPARPPRRPAEGGLGALAVPLGEALAAQPGSVTHAGTPYPPSRVGALARWARLRLGLYQPDVAARYLPHAKGVVQSYVSSIKTSKQVVGDDDLLGIAVMLKNALGCDVLDELLELHNQDQADRSRWSRARHKAAGRAVAAAKRARRAPEPEPEPPAPFLTYDGNDYGADEAKATMRDLVGDALGRLRDNDRVGAMLRMEMLHKLLGGG